MAARKKRFVAGVTCPQCDALDKIVMYDTDEGQLAQECVKCGFIDVLTDTVVDKSDIDVVTIVDPKK